MQSACLDVCVCVSLPFTWHLNDAAAEPAKRSEEDERWRVRMEGRKGGLERRDGR